jgi:recombination protein RecR
MIDQVPTLAQLIKALQQIPYLASKNIYQLTTYFLQLDPEKIEHLCTVLLKARAKIVPCSICYVWKEFDGACSYCDAPGRDAKLICVVETWQELLTIEKTGGYQGLYHVLGGVICPLDGVGPEELAIAPLIARAQSGVTEIILATNQTPEGEATAAYIARKLADTGVNISCLARGIPVGSSLAFMDRLTVYKAIADRRPF